MIQCKLSVFLLVVNSINKMYSSLHEYEKVEST